MANISNYISINIDAFIKDHPQYVDITKITDRELVRGLVKYNEKLYYHIHPTLKSDSEFAKLLIEDNPSIIRLFNMAPAELLIYAYSLLQNGNKEILSPDSKVSLGNTLATVIYNNNVDKHLPCNIELAIAAINAGASPELIIKFWQDDEELIDAINKTYELHYLKFRPSK